MREQASKVFTRRQERMLNVATKVITDVNMWLLSTSRGKLVTHFLGKPLLLLATVGRKTGKPRTTPLFYLRDGQNLVVVASAGGRSRHPAWYRNLQANPEVTVQIGRKVRKMSARNATGEEVLELWPRLTSMFWVWEKFQDRSVRSFPVVILSPR
jgi:deazaflavin-dependent oxidoreductase (nitroreductase family)